MTDFSHYTVWNKADALERLMNNETLLSKVTALYLSSTPAQLESLKQAAVSGDFSAVQAEAHTLKGTSGNIGAEQLMALFAALEVAAKEHNSSEINALINQSDEFFNLVRQEISA